MTENNSDNKTVEKDNSQKTTTKKIGVVAWIIMFAVVAFLSSTGFFLGHLLAGESQPPETAKAPDTKPVEQAASPKSGLEKNTDGTWYYNDLQSVIVNPDEPGATRFVRVALILEVSNELSQDKAKELFQSKSPVLINWLNLYFKSLSLAEMENDKDIKRILSQVCDNFNEILFPEAKPMVKNVLIREFNIQ